MARLGAGEDSSGGGSDDYSEYTRDPRREEETSYVPDEQEPDDDDEDSGGSSSGGSMSDSSSSSSGSSDSSPDSSGSNRSSAEENFDRLEDDSSTGGSRDDDSDSSDRDGGGGSTGTRGGSSSSSSDSTDSTSDTSTTNRSSAEENFDRLEGSDSQSDSTTDGSSDTNGGSDTAGSDDRRSSAEENFDRLEGSDSDGSESGDDDQSTSGSDSDRQSSQEENFDRLQDQETSTPDEGQGAGLEVYGEGYVIGGEIVTEDEARDRLGDEFESAVRDELEGDARSQFDRDDFQVNIGEDGEVSYVLSDSGAEQFQGEAGEELGSGQIPETREYARELEDRTIEETAATDETDVTISQDDEGFSSELTVSGREEEVAASLGVSASDLTLEGDQVVAETERGEDAMELQTVEQRLEEQYPDAQSMSISQAEDPDRYSFEVTTADGEQKSGSVDFSPEQRTGGQRTFRQLAREDIATEMSRETGRDVEPEDVTLEQQPGGEYSASIEMSDEERYGDFRIGVPGTNKRVEDYLEAADEKYSNALESVTEEETGVFGESAIAEGLEAAGYEDRADQVEDFGRSLLRSGGQMANVPAMALGIKEGGEAIGWAGKKTLQGEGSEVQDQVSTDFGAMKDQIGDRWENNKAAFAGSVAGSLAASTAIMGGAARLSPKLGATARMGIQPGEEIATIAGTKALQQSSRGQRVLDAIPGGRLDWEEPLVYGAAAGGRRARSGLNRARRGASDLPQRIRTEATAARFKMAEMRSPEVDTRLSMESETGQSPPDALQRFRGDDRGQAQLVPRGKTELDQETDLEADRPISEVEQRQRPRQRRRVDRDRATRPEARVETEQRTRLDREQVRRSEIRTEYGRSQTDVWAGEQTLEAADQRMEQAGRQKASIDQRPGLDTRMESRLDQRPATEANIDSRVETRLDQRQEMRLDQEMRMEMRTESRAELESRQEQRYEMSADRPPADDQPPRMDPRYDVDEDAWTWEVSFASAGEAVFGSDNEMPDLDDYDGGMP